MTMSIKDPSGQFQVWRNKPSSEINTEGKNSDKTNLSHQLVDNNNDYDDFHYLSPYRRVYPSYNETVGRPGDDFLTNIGYKGNVTPATHSSNPYSPVTNSNSNSSSGELIGSARVSHEHTDSGLGADQDYAYSSER